MFKQLKLAISNNLNKTFIHQIKNLLKKERGFIRGKEVCPMIKCADTPINEV